MSKTSSIYRAKNEDTEFEIIISDSGYISLNSLGERNPTELELFSSVRRILSPVFFPANTRPHSARFIKKHFADGSASVLMEQTSFINGFHYPSKQTSIYGLTARGEVINLCAALKDLLDLMVDRRELRVDFIEINIETINEISLDVSPDERNLIENGFLFGRAYFYDTAVEDLPGVHIEMDNTAWTIPLPYAPEFVMFDKVYLCQANCEYCELECARRRTDYCSLD